MPMYLLLGGKSHYADFMAWHGRGMCSTRCHLVACWSVESNMMTIVWRTEGNWTSELSTNVYSFKISFWCFCHQWYDIWQAVWPVSIAVQ